MTDLPPEAAIFSARRSIWQRASIVWLIPISALAIALGVAWQAFMDRGPVIEIAFQNGAGVTAGQTQLRFRDVTVGRVEKVRFTHDLSSVLVAVRLEKEVVPFVDSASKFWVVRPELTARGVSGLDTVLGGVFIEGSWDSVAGTPETEFRGLNETPLIRPGEVGLQIALRSTTQSSLTDNAPILYRGIEVGRVGRARISPRNGTAVAEAIIYEPYNKLVTDATRFWDTSGFNVSLSTTGADIKFSSLASLISGGISFDTIVSGGDPVQDGAFFQVYYEEIDARDSVFNAGEVDTLDLSVSFDDNVAGLSAGSAVELRGIKIGEVSDIGGAVTRDADGLRKVQLIATLAIQPARLGLPGDADAQAALDFLSERTRSGLRARLATASLLTGGLKVELVTLDDVPAGEIDMSGDPFPIMPAARGEIMDVSSATEGMLNRINNLPIEELLASAIEFLNASRSFVTSDEMQETPQEIRNLIGDLRALIGSQEVQEVPALLNASLSRIETLLAEIETQQMVGKLVQTLDAAAAAASSVETAVAGAPALVERFESLAAKAENLKLEDLVAEVTALADAAETLIGSDETAGLPLALTDALIEIQATLGELREGGAVENTNKALVSAQEAADAIAVSVQDLPDLMERMSQLLTKVSKTLEAYDANSNLNRDARAALLEISDAAKAFEALARTIERNPNALLLGR